MDLEGIMLNEMSRQRKADTTCFHLYVESKRQNKWQKTKLIDTENRLMVTREERYQRIVEMSEGSQRYGGGWWLDLLWPLCSVYKYQIIALYT